jgi:DNA-binding NarL/FixJ family response regulator
MASAAPISETPKLKPALHLVPSEKAQVLIAETRILIDEARRLQQQNRELCSQLCADLRHLKELARATARQTTKIGNSRVLLNSAPAQAVLTPKENAVLKLIASGYGSKQIASMMGIAFKTVVSHRTNLMSKLGIHDMVSLTRYAIRLGIVEP